MVFFFKKKKDNEEEKGDGRKEKCQVKAVPSRLFERWVETRDGWRTSRFYGIVSWVGETASPETQQKERAGVGTRLLCFRGKGMEV